MAVALACPVESLDFARGRPGGDVPRNADLLVIRLGSRLEVMKRSCDSGEDIFSFHRTGGERSPAGGLGP